MKPIKRVIQVTALFLFAGFAGSAGAQVSDKVLEHVKKRKALQEELNTNFSLAFPNENTDVSKPFRIAGYGVPGAKVEIHITPMSQGGKGGPEFVAKGTQNTYRMQSYFVTVRDDGTWSLDKDVTTRFHDGAKDKKVRVFAGQSKGAVTSKKPVNKDFRIDPTFKVIKVIRR